MRSIQVLKNLDGKKEYVKVFVPETKDVFKGESTWKKIVRKENVPIAIYNEDGVLKEVVTRTGRPISRQGPWAFKYRGYWYSTQLDSLYQFGTLRIGSQKPLRKGGSRA